jgi:Dicarboxylate transport
MIFNGAGILEPDRVTIDGVLNDYRTSRLVAGVALEHGLTTAVGSVVATIDQLRFEKRAQGNGTRGLQPDDLSPRLRGLINEAQGAVSGVVTVGWRPDAPLATAASMTMDQFNFVSPAGSLEAINGTITLDDLLTQRTAGMQTLTIGEFNPGLALPSGVVRFALPGNGSLVVDQAVWPYAGGRLLVDPTVFRFDEEVQAFNVRVDAVNLNAFIVAMGLKNLEVTGTASGLFPMVLEGNVASIRNGYLAVDENGGLIRYTGVDPSPAPPPQTWWQRLTRQPPPPPQGLALAIAALRNLDYKVLRVSVDGPLTGDIDVGVAISGSNRDVLNGTPFTFRVVTDLPIAQLMAVGPMFTQEYYIQRVIEERRRQLQNPPSQ